MARITVRRMLRGGIAERVLSAHDALVLLALIDRADHEGIAWPSQYTLAADLGMARSTVQAALSRLLEAGEIVEHEPGRQGRSTRYRVVSQLARHSGQLVALN